MSSKSPGLKRKQMMVRILMLDDTEVPFQIEPKMIGNDLINSVYEYLKLVESDYFGLEYYDSKGKKCWLDYDKFVTKQVQYESKLIFGVKFYTPDPGQLEEEYTRYLYALQIKRDLAEGLLLCSDATASLLVSYILQAEIGDFSDAFNDDPNYIINKRYFPHQNEEHISKIIEYHKSHIGQTPADADLNLLDIARKVELYGIVMHPAKDHENVQLNLAVANMGILVFQNYTKINTFSWAKIRKLSFRRKKFLVKLHSENYGFYKDTVEFYFDNRDDSKSFWKKCIEHHSFFRCISIMRIPRQKSKIFATRGSSFRYYGRTQKELIENARENFSKNRSFDRSYHSIRSIVTNHREPGQINGTQSLNRNLASRSAGALMIPSTGGCGSSTLSSNDSDHHYNLGMNQNTSSSAHHLSFNTHQSLKTPAIYAETNKSSMSLKSLTDQRSSNDNNLPFLSNQLQDDDNLMKQRQNFEEDAATHGTRTIDSRHSNDKTLGLSDGDESDENEEDEIDGDFDDEEKAHLNNEKLHLAKSVNDFESCTCGKEHHNNHINKERKQDNDEKKNESEINKSLPNFFNELGNNKFDENISRKNANNLIISPNASPVITNNLKLQTGISDQQYYHVHQKDLIKLPITQEKKAKDKVKLEIINSSSSSTDNEAASHLKKSNIQNNPNKIYSRKEVVTTSFKEEIKKSHLEEYRQTTTFYDPISSSSFKPQASSLLANVQKSSNGDYSQATATQNDAIELKQPNSLTNKFQKKQRSIDQLIYDKSDNERCLSDDDEGKRLKNLDINKSSNSCSVSNDNLNEKDYDSNFDKLPFEKITGDLEVLKHSNKFEVDKKSKSKTKQKYDHHKEQKNKKNKKSNHLRCEKKSSRQHFANEPLVEEDRFNSLKKLTKTPVFITSTRLMEDNLSCKVSNKNYQLNHKNKILVQDQELRKKRNNALKNNCDFIFISNSELSNGEVCSKSKTIRDKDLNFSLSSAISSSSLSYVKDMPLPSLSSSSSSDFSLISKPLSSSSSIDLSSINSSSVDSLRVSMIELSQLSADLNKKIIKSLKKDVGVHGNKHVLVVPINKPKKKNHKEKVEIPINNKIFHNPEDDSIIINTENQINKSYEETDCLNLTSIKKDFEHNKLKKCDGIIVSAHRKKSKNKTKKHKEKKSSSSHRNKSQHLSKSLPRCKKSTNDYEFNHNYPAHNKKNFEPIKMSNSCQAVNQSDYRKIVNSFDLNLTNSVIVNGSTPNKYMTMRKNNNDLETGSMKNKEFSSSLSEALSEIGKENLSILQNSEKGENLTKQTYDLNESVSENSNATNNSEDSSKTIRQILNKIVEAKISTMNSDNLIKNGNSLLSLIDNLDENDNASNKNSNDSNEFKDKSEIFNYQELSNNLEFIDSQDCITKENIGNNEIIANLDEINSSDINNENFVESIPLIESEMSISVCLDQIDSDQIQKVQKNNLDFYPEEEANVIRNTVYKVLEMATEIVAEEYNLSRNKKSVTDNTTINDEQRTKDSSYL